MNRFTRDRNINSAVSVINSRLATETTLRELINLQGADNETLENIESEIQTSNTELQTINTTLNTGNDKVDQSNQKLDNIIEEAELLQKQHPENVTNYDFDIFSSQLVPSVPIAPANNYIKDPYNRNSWYLNNVNTPGNTQLYWFASDQPFAYKTGSTFTLGQIIEGGGFYFSLYIDKVDDSLSLPIFGVYTTPTGSGDAVPSFYKSRKTYRIATNQKVYSGELIVCYNSVTVLDKIKNVLPTCRRVLLTQSSSVGPVSNDETIRFMSINHDSLAPSSVVQWSIVGAGIYDGSLSNPILRHFTFTTSTQQIGEQQVNDTGTQTLLTNTNETLGIINDKIGSLATEETLDDVKDEIKDTNDKLNVIHDDIIDTEDLIRDVKEILQDIETNTGATTGKISQLNVFNKSLLVQQVQNNKIHYMMSSRSGGGDTSGPLIVQNERTTTHILPLLVAERFIVQSSNDLNNFVGNLGLYNVKIEGVGADGNLDSELLDVNGVNPVQSSKNYFHINKIEARLGNLSSGQVFVKRQDGVIYCQLSDGGLVLGNGFFMMPSDYEGYIQSMFGNDLVASNMFIVKYNANSHTRNPIYRFFNRSNVSLIFEAGLGIPLAPREAIYLWNNETTGDTTHYNFKIEMVPLSQTS